MWLYLAGRRWPLAASKAPSWAPFFTLRTNRNTTRGGCPHNRIEAGDRAAIVVEKQAFGLTASSLRSPLMGVRTARKLRPEEVITDRYHVQRTRLPYRPARGPAPGRTGRAAPRSRESIRMLHRLSRRVLWSPAEHLLLRMGVLRGSRGGTCIRSAWRAGAPKQRRQRTGQLTMTAGSDPPGSGFRQAWQQLLKLLARPPLVAR
jgi:hypothetical protein